MRTDISPSSSFVSSGKGSLTIGDYCRIGPGVKIIVGDGDVKIDDWTTIHDNSLVLGGKGVTIGEHCWFGQNSIIDGTGGLTIGNGVRVGMYSQIWSHVAAGEQIEGCTLYSERPVVIQDDVWLVGSCTVGSGVNIGKRVIALSGSNITKSFPDNVVVAGAPASIKEGLCFYKDLGLEEKFSLLRSWLPEAVMLENNVLSLMSDDGTVNFCMRTSDAIPGEKNRPDQTWCSLEDKTYNKTFSPAEEKVLKYLSGNKARFRRRHEKI